MYQLYNKMIKTFKTVKSLNKFLIDFGHHMDFMNDTVLISNDIKVDVDYAVKEWKSYGCAFPLKIYIRQHGTFNNWSSGTVELERNIKYWEDELIGLLTITKEGNVYNVSFDYTQYMPFA